MSHVVVFNSSAKSVKIPTTPVKYLTEVRDDACQKLGVRNDQYTLKYNNKPISLSQQIRLANLPQGARLELVQASRSPTVISVALQLPASEKNVRLTQKFASNTSLWEILRHFESGQGAIYNFTQRGVPQLSTSGTSGSGRLNYEMPVITVMPGHREQSDFVGLQQTLNQLGFENGSALLRLSFKNSGTPLEEAMGQISQYFKSSDSNPPLNGAHAASSAQANSTSDPEKATPEASAAAAASKTILLNESNSEPMDVDTTQAPSAEVVPTVPSSNSATEQTASIPSQPEPTQTVAPAPSSQPSNAPRNVQVFSAPTSSTPQAARQVFNENDYVPTVEHAKAHQAALQTRTKNQRLLSDKELEDQETERLQKLNAVADKGGSLRIRMPDGIIVQMDITKSDTAEILYDFVTGFLERKQEPFQLKYVGPNGRLTVIPRDKKRLMQDLRFSPMEMITFLWADNASAEARSSRKTVAQEWQSKAQALKVEEPVTTQTAEASSAKQSVAEGKRKAGMSSEDKESKLKNILGKGLFKRK